MRVRRLAVGAAAAAVLVAGQARPAEGSAIPAFARKYGVTCSVCHAPAPRLNAVGERFAENGFEFLPGEPARDTIPTGDGLLRLLSRLDLAVRLDAYATGFYPLDGDAARVDLQAPYGIKLLSGGPISEKVSYYMYFYLSERGAVAGLEDAYIQFTDLGGTGVNVMIGQFQVSDPLFKRELRLSYEDYQPYRVRVGAARADLTYDRGVMTTWSPWEGGDLAALVVNGQGLREAGADRAYDRDAGKSVALRYSHDLGRVRAGAFGYAGRERVEGVLDRIAIYGADATVAIRRDVELNLQLLRRTDSDPFFGGASGPTRVDAAFAEAVWSPAGPAGRWFVTGLFNWISADRPAVSLRLGEQDTPEAYLRRYRTASAGVHYLLARNIRVMGEAGWDLERGRPRLTAGTVLAW